MAHSRGWASAGNARVCYTIVAARGAEDYAGLLDSLFRADLEAAGVRASRAPPDGIGECDAVLALVATGGTERSLLELVETLPEHTPVAVVAHPAANSAASLAEVRYDLIRLGAAPVILGPLGIRRPSTLAGLRAIARGLAAAATLRHSRVGVVGGPAPWLPHDGRPLARILGLEVVDIPVEELFRRLPSEPPSLDILPGRLLDSRVDPVTLRSALRVYAALKSLASDYALDAISPSCPSFMEEAGSNACLAMALLNDEGITVGCEGDLAATISLHLAQAAALRAGFLANTAWVRGNRVLLAHCGAPPSMGLSYSLERHILTRRSPTLAVWFPRGAQVTLAQAGYRGGVLILGEGRIIEGTPWRGRQCESQMLVELPGERSLAASLTPIEAGNHVAAVLGRHADAMAIAWLTLNPGAPLAIAGELRWP